MWYLVGLAGWARCFAGAWIWRRDDRVEQGDGDGHLVTEPLFCDSSELFFATSGPLRLSDVSHSGDVGCDRLYRDAAVTGPRERTLAVRLRRRLVDNPLDNVDVVAIGCR